MKPNSIIDEISLPGYDPGSPGHPEESLVLLSRVYEGIGLPQRPAWRAAQADLASGLLVTVPSPPPPPTSGDDALAQCPSVQPVVGAAPPFWKLAAAFGAIYFIWGSTFLALRLAVETIPPFLTAGLRALTAGLLLYGWGRVRHRERPTAKHWTAAAVAGWLMLTIGNGGVTWSQLHIPSGVAALIIALIPVWMALLDWVRPAGVRPTRTVVGGLAAGLAGVGVLAWRYSQGGAPLLSVWVLVLASLAWAAGSVWSRHAAKPRSSILGAGMQMIVGGGTLLLLSLLRGEPARMNIADITLTSVLAWSYLTLAGSLVGYTSYVWLLQVSTPARVGTYAFVNPLIAVLLGCTLGREPAGPELVFSAVLILVAVALIILAKRPFRREAGDAAATEHYSKAT